MRQVFPDSFEDAEPKRKTSVVAPATRSTAPTPRGHSITPEVLAEFRVRGVVGRSDGFSEIGAMLAGKLNAERMDAMF